MVSVLEKKVPEWKIQKVEELAKQIDSYDVVAIANLHKVRAIQLQDLKKRFKDDPLTKVTKNNLMRLALQHSKKPGIERLSEKITGPNVIILTNMNPFKLSLLLDMRKIMVAAKAGDVAQNDIVVRAGNTGMPPGPAMSDMRELGIQTKIELGSVFVVRDTVVAKKGDSVSPNLASMLSKLGIKPLEVGLSLNAAYNEGVILAGDQLHLDLEDTREQLQTAWNHAFSLAFEAGYPTPETIVSLLRRAYSEARSLAINSAYPAPEVINDILAKAHAQMLSLSERIGQPVSG